MSEFWNQKYNTKEYLYGTEPNSFLKDELLKLEPGSILLPAEGEGRNAVFAAVSGWQVTAFDPSKVGQQKALNLAREHKVSINYLMQGYENTAFPDNSFDAIGLTFTHMTSNLRQIMHKKYIGWLKPGGKIIMEAFSKEQLNYRSGGPKDIEMLFSEEEIRNDFSGLSNVHISRQLVKLDEGHGHQGMASVVQLIGTK